MLRAHRICRALTIYKAPCMQQQLFTPTIANSGQHIRRCSNKTSLVQVERDPKHKDIAWFRLNRKPVNSLNNEFLTEIDKSLEEIENDDSYRGLILTSAIPGIFSAGLDITELYQQTPEYYGKFWHKVQGLWLKLYASPLAVIGALNGHSPAAGCLIALCCDYRIMATGKYIIGLNEVLLGVVPPIMKYNMQSVVGNRHTERALQLGTLFGVDEAVRIGLVDQAVSPESLEDAARTEMIKWLKIPDHARTLTKQMMRGDSIQRLQNNREKDIEHFVNMVSNKKTQDHIGQYLHNLKTRKK